MIHEIFFINRYVIYNYVDQTWSIGQSLLRTAWEDSDVFDTPIAADISGDIFDQETGFNNNGSAIRALLLSNNPLNISTSSLTTFSFKQVDINV